MSKDIDSNKKQHDFYGTTVLGERGQVVIPVKARKDLKLKKGEHLLVCCAGDNMIVLVKTDHAKEFAAHLAKKLESINSIFKKKVEI